MNTFFWLLARKKEYCQWKQIWTSMWKFERIDFVPLFLFGNQPIWTYMYTAQASQMFQLK